MRLGGHADKPFFEPIVQVVHLKKNPSNQFHDVHLSNGMYYMIGTCAEPVSALADEEYITLFSLIKVQEFAATTLVNGSRSCELLCVENTMIPSPGGVIENLVNILLPAAVARLPERSYSQCSPLPTSIKFEQAMRTMRGSDRKSGSGGGSGDDFNNIMRVMMMQQQSDQEQRLAGRE